MQSITIAGGGITGLAFLHYMTKLNNDTSLYEQKNRLTDPGSGILLGVNAMKVLRDMGLENKITEAGQRLDYVIQSNSKGTPLTAINTGELFNECGLPTIAISRPDLHRILADSNDQGKINKEKKITGIKQWNDSRVILKFSDGTHVTSDFMIAADGIHSATRESAFGPSRLRYSGYTCWRFIVDSPPSLQLNIAFEMLGKGKRFGIFPIGDNKLYCFATANSPAGFYHASPLSKKQFVRLFSEFSGSVPDILANFLADTRAELDQRDIYDLHNTILTKKGCHIIFAGDAGHATTPNLGQGAAMGLEDAYTFYKIMQEEFSCHEAASEFHRRRYRRVESIRKQSLLLGKIGQLENPLLSGFRNMLMKILPRNTGKKQMQKLLLDSFNL